MKKVIGLLIIAVLVCGTAFASNIGTEPLLNRIFDGNNRVMKVALSGDVIQQDTQTLKVLDAQDFKQLNGNTWFVVSADGLTISGAPATIDYVIGTPAVTSGQVWAVLSIATENNAIVSVFEDVTPTYSSGTDMEVFNVDRSRTSSPVITVSRDPGVVDEGTLIYQARQDSGYIPNSNALDNFGLQANTYYCVRVSSDGTAGWTTANMKFYVIDFWD